VGHLKIKTLSNNTSLAIFSYTLIKSSDANACCYYENKMNTVLKKTNAVNPGLVVIQDIWPGNDIGILFITALEPKQGKHLQDSILT